MEHKNEQPKPYAKLENAVYSTIPKIVISIGLLVLALAFGFYEGQMSVVKPEKDSFEEQLNALQFRYETAMSSSATWYKRAG